MNSIRTPFKTFASGAMIAVVPGVASANTLAASTQNSIGGSMGAVHGNSLHPMCVYGCSGYVSLIHAVRPAFGRDNVERDSNFGN